MNIGSSIHIYTHTHTRVVSVCVVHVNAVCVCTQSEGSREWNESIKLTARNVYVLLYKCSIAILCDDVLCGEEITIINKPYCCLVTPGVMMADIFFFHCSRGLCLQLYYNRGTLTGYTIVQTKTNIQNRDEPILFLLCRLAGVKGRTSCKCRHSRIFVWNWCRFCF